MTDYEPKKGERVLVGGTVCCDTEMIVPGGSPRRWPVSIDGEIRSARLSDIHLHPGVPVAAVLKELGNLWKYINGLPFDARSVGEMRQYVVGDLKFHDPVLTEAEALRSVRKAANNPPESSS